MSSRAVSSCGLLLTIVLGMTWPLIIHLKTAATPGFETSKTVLLLNEWTVGWNADRAAHGGRDYWQAPHFSPEKQTLALSEPIFASLAVAPLVWLTGTPVVAYNVFLLGSLALNGWVTWWVLRTRGCHWILAVLGGWGMIGLPLVYEQIGVLQSIPLAGSLATIHFAADALESNRRRSFLAAGLCLGLTYLTCAHYGLFLAMLVAASGGVVIGKDLVTALFQRFGNGSDCSPLRSRVSVGQAVCNLGLGVSVAAVLIGPMAVAQSRALSNPAYERPKAVIRDLSALPADYLATPFPEWLRFVGLAQWHDPARWALSQGCGKLLLAAIGIGLGLRCPRRRPWVLFLTVLTWGAFFASLGLNLRLANWSPYESLLDWLPGLSKVRAPGRFAVFVQIGAVLLSMETVQFLHRWSFVVWRRSQRLPLATNQSFQSRSRLTARCFVAAVWLVGVFVCCEVRLPPLRLVRIPAVETQQGWIGWLQEHTPRDAVIAHLPFPQGKSPDDYETEAWAMYWSLFHDRRLVNGYSGFFPPSYLKLKAQVQRFPDEESIAALRLSGARYLVIPEAFARSRQLIADHLVQKNLELLWHDEAAGQLIFGLRAVATRRHGEPGTADE